MNGWNPSVFSLRRVHLVRSILAQEDPVLLCQAEKKDDGRRAVHLDPRHRRPVGRHRRQHCPGGRNGRVLQREDPVGQVRARAYVLHHTQFTQYVHVYTIPYQGDGGEKARVAGLRSSLCVWILLRHRLLRLRTHPQGQACVFVVHVLYCITLNQQQL